MSTLDKPFVCDRRAKFMIGFELFRDIRFMSFDIHRNNTSAGRNWELLIRQRQDLAEHKGYKEG